MIMNRESDNDGVLHTINNVFTTLAVLCLFWSLLEFLWRRRSTAWLATALLFFVPVWLAVGFVVCESYWLATDKCLTSDFAIGVLTLISAIITLVVSVCITIADNPPSVRRERRLDEKWEKWAAQYSTPWPPPTSRTHLRDRRER